jgi:hypothetical protein
MVLYLFHPVVNILVWDCAQVASSLSFAASFFDTQRLLLRSMANIAWDFSCPSPFPCMVFISASTFCPPLSFTTATQQLLLRSMAAILHGISHAPFLFPV